MYLSLSIWCNQSNQLRCIIPRQLLYPQKYLVVQSYVLFLRKTNILHSYILYLINILPARRKYPTIKWKSSKMCHTFVHEVYNWMFHCVLSDAKDKQLQLYRIKLLNEVTNSKCTCKIFIHQLQYQNGYLVFL